LQLLLINKIGGEDVQKIWLRRFTSTYQVPGILQNESAAIQKKRRCSFKVLKRRINYNPIFFKVNISWYFIWYLMLIRVVVISTGWL
jgi:hypothetical protein